MNDKIKRKYYEFVEIIEDEPFTSKRIWWEIYDTFRQFMKSLITFPLWKLAVSILAFVFGINLIYFYIYFFIHIMIESIVICSFLSIVFRAVLTCSLFILYDTGFLLFMVKVFVVLYVCIHRLIEDLLQSNIYRFYHIHLYYSNNI